LNRIGSDITLQFDLIDTRLRHFDDDGIDPVRSEVNEQLLASSCGNLDEPVMAHLEYLQLLGTPHVASPSRGLGDCPEWLSGSEQYHARIMPMGLLSASVISSRQFHIVADTSGSDESTAVAGGRNLGGRDSRWRPR
jgi:hypothetical protein